MLAPTLCATLALLAPTRWELSLSVDGYLAGGVATQHPADSFSSEPGGGASVGVRRYLTPVVDDATPYALQPYLQRASWLGVTAGAEHTVEPADEVPGNPASGGARVDAAVSGQLFLTHGLALRGSVAAHVHTVGTGAHQDVPVALAAVLRPGDLELALGVQTGWRHDSTDPRLDGADLRFLVDGRVVLLEHISVSLGASIGPEAFDIHFLVEYYASKRFGMFAGGVGGGALSGGWLAPVAANLPSLWDLGSFGVQGGLSYWWPPVGVSLLWTPTWSQSDLGGLLEQRLAVVVTVRGQ